VQRIKLKLTLASRAEEELVANSRIFVPVVTVHAGAVGRRIGRFCFIFKNKIILNIYLLL
jgi:hypothetical protein